MIKLEQEYEYVPRKNNKMYLKNRLPAVWGDIK